MVDLAKLILTVIAIVITVILVALTFVARNNISRTPNLAQNANLQSGLRYINITLAFFGIGILLMFVILVLIFFENPTMSKIVRILTYITFPIITLAWIFSIIATFNIQRSRVTSGPARSAYFYMIGVSIVTILSWIGLLAALILLVVGRNKKVQELAKEQFKKAASAVGLKTKSKAKVGEDIVVEKDGITTGRTFTSRVISPQELSSKNNRYQYNNTEYGFQGQEIENPYLSNNFQSENYYPSNNSIY